MVQGIRPIRGSFYNGTRPLLWNVPNQYVTFQSLLPFFPVLTISPQLRLAASMVFEPEGLLVLETGVKCGPIAPVLPKTIQAVSLSYSTLQIPRRI